MSRLAGRLSMAKTGNPETDRRNKRMMAGMLDHLNAPGSGTSRNQRAPRKQESQEEKEEVVERRFTRSQANRGGSGINIERGNSNPNHYRGRGSGRGRGGANHSNSRQNERFENFHKAEPDTDNSERRAPRKPTQKIEDSEPAEELIDLEEIIAQISDLNIRSDRSAAQIKRNIIKSTELTDTMDEDEWQQLCECLINTALDQGEHDFVVDLFVSLLKNEQFCESMSGELMSISSQHIMSNGQKSVPTFLSSIMCAHWPRQYSKAIDSVNLILFSTACIIKGWIQVLDEDTARFYKDEKKAAAIEQEMMMKKKKHEEEEGDEEEGSENAPDDEVAELPEAEPEDPIVVAGCAMAICELCESAQRQLWLKWPTICDEIYASIKPAITHNTNLNSETKSRLLNAYLLINTWTRSRAVSTKNQLTQTVPSSEV